MHFGSYNFQLYFSQYLYQSHKKGRSKFDRNGVSTRFDD